MKKLMRCFWLLASLCFVLMSARAAAQSPPKVALVNGVELHYIEKGSGAPVIFVHGGLEDYRAWADQVEAFSKRYHAVAYSRRYNFPNARTALADDYSASADAQDLAALIKQLGLAPAHVVGYSYGAYAALFLALGHPELVRSLVLSEPPVLRLLAFWSSPRNVATRRSPSCASTEGGRPHLTLAGSFTALCTSNSTL